MKATVVLVGTLDTKGAEYRYVAEILNEQGVEPLFVDASTQGSPAAGIVPDVVADEVASAAGAERSALVVAGDRGAAIAAMGRGAAAVVLDLHAQGRLQAIMGLGGSGGTALVSQAMRALPVGVPKVLVSTMASGDVRPYVDTSDITLMYSVVDIAGINRLSRRILGNAAAAAAAMARFSAGATDHPGAKPLVGATMFGVTTPCVTAAREWLEQHGYEVLVFHATGSGGRSMESLMESGYITAGLDITTTELADDLVGGVLSAGPRRLEMAARLGLPHVVSLGALDMVNFGPPDTVPGQFDGRSFYQHNPSVTLMRTTPQETAELGRRIARKLNDARGPVALYIPLQGVSAIDRPGMPFHDVDADRALFAALTSELSEAVELHELDLHINDPAFAVAMAKRLDELYQEWQRSRGPAGYGRE